MGTQGGIILTLRVFIVGVVKRNDLIKVLI